MNHHDAHRNYRGDLSIKWGKKIILTYSLKCSSERHIGQQLSKPPTAWGTSPHSDPQGHTGLPDPILLPSCSPSPNRSMGTSTKKPTLPLKSHQLETG